MVAGADADAAARPRISATSCGWTPSSAKETSAPRSLGVERAVDASRRPRRRGAPARRRRARARGRARASMPMADEQVDRGAEADDLGDRRRPRLELRRRLRPADLVERRPPAIMCPPPINGGIAASSVAAAVQDADARRARRPCGRSRRRSRRRARRGRPASAARPGSRRPRRPRRRRARGAAISATGLIVPTTLETWATATTLTSPPASSASSCVELEHGLVVDRRPRPARRRVAWRAAATARSWSGAPSRVTRMRSPAPTCASPQA